MILDKILDIMNDTGYSNPSLAFLGLSNVVIPADDRELLKRGTPVEAGALLVELLLNLLETTLLDLILGKGLEVVGKTQLLHGPDEPLGGVILPPLDRVAEVARELVVEVMVALTKRDEGSDDMVSRRVAVVEGLVSEPVGQTVHTESGLLNEETSRIVSV